MLQLRRLALALLASSVALVACGDDVTGTDANNATVQFINATEVSLDVAQGGTVATGNGAKLTSENAHERDREVLCDEDWHADPRRQRLEQRP